MSAASLAARIVLAAALGGAWPGPASATPRSARGDAPPARVFAPPHLDAAPRSATMQCRLAQGLTPVPILCPRVLPRAWQRPWRVRSGTAPPVLSVQRVRYRDRGGSNVLLTFAYGAPWEPESGPGWRQHLWRNRPCCFLHFEVFARVAGKPLTAGRGERALLGGRRGIYLPALGYRPQCRSPERGAFWCNHAVFVWRRAGVQYAATLHAFGAGTRQLLGRLVAGLAPVGR